MAPMMESPPQSPVRSFSRPRPRAPRSPEETARVRVRNRRREYLARHPEYFASADHELADPVRYDALIRRFQTPAEREADGKAKGYSRVLESSLLLGEARLGRARVAASASAFASASASGSAQQQEEPQERQQQQQPAGGDDGTAATSSPASTSTVEGYLVTSTAEVSEARILAAAAALDAAQELEQELRRDEDGMEMDEDEEEERPGDRAEARQRWEDFLRDRFVGGRDDDFDYGAVDADDDLDALERADAEEAWFEEEEPAWASDEPAEEGPGGNGGGGRRRRERLLGETGVQDF